MRSVRELHDELSADLSTISNQVCATAGTLDIAPQFRSELRVLDEKISELLSALNEEIPSSSQKAQSIFSIRIRSAISDINQYLSQMCQITSEVAELKTLMDFPKQFLASTNGKSSPIAVLTKREKEILALLPKGATAKAMASELYLTEATIKTHLASIYRKFEVMNRTQAIAIALENKLITF